MNNPMRLIKATPTKKLKWKEIFLLQNSFSIQVGIYLVVEIGVDLVLSIGIEQHS